VLDIGTGSGCIAIATAHHSAGVLVDATDVSTDALEVAAANVARHALGERVRLHRADLFPPTDVRYRVIVSNPPYVSAREMAELPPEYRHEPQLALAGGASGFEPAERILRGALSRLAPDGCVFVEVGAGAEAFAAAHPRLAATWLTFDRGGDGVFVLTAAELEEFLRRR
jgi:ribosomal protein L3 glutamine methyltransferase